MLTGRLRRRLPKADGRLVGIYLALVGVLAVVAIIQLAHTWFSARHIAANADYLSGRVHAVHLNTTHLTVLDQTDSLTRQIAAAARPLDGQVGQVRHDASDIATQVQLVRSNAATIAERVDSINHGVTGINAALAGLVGTTSSIAADATHIQGSFRSLEGTTRSINVGVAGINHRAITVMDIVQAIRHDTGNIIGEVGAVRANARSIDCSHIVHGPACY